jgi:hypothetical protein
MRGCRLAVQLNHFTPLIPLYTTHTQWLTPARRCRRCCGTPRRPAASGRRRATRCSRSPAARPAAPAGAGAIPLPPLPPINHGGGVIPASFPQHLISRNDVISTRPLVMGGGVICSCPHAPLGIGAEGISTSPQYFISGSPCTTVVNKTGARHGSDSSSAPGPPGAIASDGASLAGFDAAVRRRPVAAGEKGVRGAQKMRVGPRLPVGIQL